MRIGILGGTFDPIHCGHLYLAKKVCRKLKLDKIIFIPTYLTPHKSGIRITAAKHRYIMVKLAIANNRNLEISDIEIDRKGRSYSVETLRQLRKRYGLATEIFFITGSDSLRDLDKWKDLNAIASLCKFVVVKRPGFPIKNVPENFIVLDIRAKDISATAIRSSIAGGTIPIKQLVPGPVIKYIHLHNLYD